MKVIVRKQEFSPDEIKRELDETNTSEKKYFDLMYQTLQFTFGSIIAVAGFGFGFFTETEVSLQYCSLLFSYVLPACLYIFGIMYAYNAYCLALLGRKSEILHKRLYLNKKSDDLEVNDMMKRYVISSRYVTLLAYGVPLGCYLAIPYASVYFSRFIFAIDKNSPGFYLYHIIPGCILILYTILMLVMICAIAKHHFIINRIQKK